MDVSTVLACGEHVACNVYEAGRQRTGCMEFPRDVAGYDAVTMVHPSVDLVLLNVRVHSSTKANESRTDQTTRQSALYEASPNKPTKSPPAYLDDRSPSVDASCLWNSTKNGKWRGAAVKLLTRPHFQVSTSTDTLVHTTVYFPSRLRSSWTNVLLLSPLLSSNAVSFLCLSRHEYAELCKTCIFIEQFARGADGQHRDDVADVATEADSSNSSSCPPTPSKSSLLWIHSFSAVVRSAVRHGHSLARFLLPASPTAG